MRRAVLLGLVIGCGRIGFEPLALTTTDSSMPACGGSLLGYWPMEVSDVGVTGTVHDRSGNGYDGTFVGTPTPIVAPGHVGDALAYAATGNAYVSVPALPLDPASGAAITIAMWFQRPDVNVDDGLIYTPASPKYDLWLTRDPRCPGLCLCINTANGDCWGLVDATLVDRWVHVAVILRNGPTTASELYIDGVPRPASCVFGACTQSGTIRAPFEIGGSDTYNWHGLVDDVRVYPRALSGVEIANVYAGACGP